MDEHGCYRATPEDWDELAKLFDEKENILFPYSCDGAGAMIVSINREFDINGTMPFGGRPHGHATVGILRRGFDHIDIDREQFSSYLSEHLHLPESEGEGLAELLNEMRKRRS